VGGRACGDHATGDCDGCERESQCEEDAVKPVSEEGHVGGG